MPMGFSCLYCVFHLDAGTCVMLHVFFSRISLCARSDAGRAWLNLCPYLLAYTFKALRASGAH